MAPHTAISSVDRRIPDLIRSCSVRGHRSLFLVLGDQDLSITSLLLHISLSSLPSTSSRRLLWCHKLPGLPNGLHAPRRLVRDLRHRVNRSDVSVQDSTCRLDLLQAAVELHSCTYSQSVTLLGQTFDSAVLQDVSALTPNLLAQSIETVRGGGVIIIVCPEVNSLEDLARLNMDAHARYRTPNFRKVKARFNLRFLRSLAFCDDAMVLDKRGSLLNISNGPSQFPVADEDSKDNMRLERAVKKVIKKLGNENFTPLIKQCQTADQAKVLKRMISAVVDPSENCNTVVAVTAARGRGKSAAVGLCVAAALSAGISSVWVATPTPETASTLLHFVVVGLRLLEFEEGKEFGHTNVGSSSDVGTDKAKIQTSEHPSEIWFRRGSDKQRQHVRLLRPLQAASGNRCDYLQSCDLLCIDEAAAIPLSVVRTMLAAVPGSHVLMASTVNGYEGTGRSLSLKLLTELRNKQDRPLKELKLHEAIRYQPGDRIEKWLSDVLCLDCCDDEETTVQEAPSPEACQLLLIDRTSLFSGHKSSEHLLRRLTSLFVSSHYRNSPNDLQLIADSPSQFLFVLSSLPTSSRTVPEPLVALQVAVEGSIPLVEVRRAMSGTQRPAGDLMPWTLAQQFCQEELATRLGARVVRIAVLPELQGRGYGSRALQLLHTYLEGEGNLKGKMETDNEEKVWPPSFDSLSPLLSQLDEGRGPGKVDYVGVSFGLTVELLKFWRRAGYRPVYLRHTRSEQTGEHSCLMIRGDNKWVIDMEKLFVRDFIRVSPISFTHLSPTLALSLIRRRKMEDEDELTLNGENFSDHDLKQLRSYCRGQCDFHMLLKLLPALCEAFYTCRLRPEPALTLQEEYILFCIGGQANSRVEDVAQTLSSCLHRQVTTGQVLGLFKRMMTRFLSEIEELNTRIIGRKRQMEDHEPAIKKSKTNGEHS